jgi:HK97 family phage major capsid protein
MSEDTKKVENDMQIDEMAKKMAEAIKSELGIETSISGVQDEMKKIREEMEAGKKQDVYKVFVSEDVKKDVSELTKEEKVDAYARAIFTADTVALKALSEGVNADGGFTVPQDFYATLLEEIQEQAIMRGLVTVIPMKTNVLTLSMIDHGPDVYWTSEGATKTTTTADFSQPTITAYKLAAIIYLTDELIDDSAFSLTQVLVRRFAQKIAEKEDQAIFQGTGVGQPTGLMVAATIPTIACSGNLDFDDIIDLEYALPIKFRPNARFFIHPTNVRELRKIKDTTGRYIWQDPIAPGQPATIHGYPVVENYWMSEDDILFGDVKECYWLGDRQRMTVKITNDTETTFTQDKTAIRVVERIGGTVVFPNAMRQLTTIP